MEACENETAVLKVNNLSTSFFTSSGIIRAVSEVSFSLRQKRCLALIGESGAGKSVTALSLLRMVPPPGKIISGEVYMDGKNLLDLSQGEIRGLRGEELSIMFQDPLASFNPVITVGSQIRETIFTHRRIGKKEAEELMLDKLAALKLPARRVAQSYPFQLSGGMRQRAALALALVLHPQVLIADEPTSFLDVTLQGQILAELQHQLSACCLSLLFITHDLAAAAAVADMVAVMYGGMLVEYGPLQEVFYNPAHPYTRALLKSHPAFCKEGRLQPIAGNAPRINGFFSGCSFQPRCVDAESICRELTPGLQAISDDRNAACHLLTPAQKKFYERSYS